MAPDIIRRWFQRQALVHKLTAVVLTIATVTLLLACVVFVIYDYSAARNHLISQVTMLADAIGSNSTGALTFGDPKAGEETLRTASVNEHIISARLIDKNGGQLASYTKDGSATQPPFEMHVFRDPQPVSEFGRARLYVLRPISHAGEVLGSIVLESDTREIWSRLAGFVFAIAGVVFGTFWVAFLLSRAAARVTLRPIDRLIGVTWASYGPVA